MSPEDQLKLENTYVDRCYPKLFKFLGIRRPDASSSCSAIDRFRAAFDSYRQGIQDPGEQATAVFNIASNFEQFSDFSDFVKWVGGPSNFYLTSVISGFREGSENLSTPVYSNTLGQTDNQNPNGVIDSAESILGMGDGEFEAQWIRDTL